MDCDLGNIKYTERMIRCSRCIYDESIGSIIFDNQGVCNYCSLSDSLINSFGKDKFDKIVNKIKRDGRGLEFDCIVGVSGGTDSSYMLHLCIKYGLRPLAVHYDNTWNSSIAAMNIARITRSLGVPLETYVCDNFEVCDIVKSFLRASVAEIEGPTDLALAEVINRAAKKHKVKYVFEGHSFITEGISPLNRNYFDGKYIKSIHKEFGSVPLKTYPLMSLTRFIYWIAIARIQKIRPFWFLEYSKEKAKEILMNEYDWQDYGGHHLENKLTAFYHEVYAPRKFKTDFRQNVLSARVRNGNLNRSEAIRNYLQYDVSTVYLEQYFRDRLSLSRDEYEVLMNASPRNWTEFRTNKKFFERFSFFFLIASRFRLVPHSFYLKYCKKVQHDYNN